MEQEVLMNTDQQSATQQSSAEKPQEAKSASNINKRGFASMDKEKQRAIASKGGKAAHQKGTAHEFTPSEAAAAGRKGGLAGKNKNGKVS
jgi:general stress protein YciG